MPTITNSVTGRQGTMFVEGTFLAITTWELTVAKDYADSTDSNTLDPATGQVWKTKAPGAIGMEGTAQGNIDLDKISDEVIGRLQADGPYSVTLGITRTKNFVVDTLFNIESFQMTVSVPAATMCTFNMRISSQGVPTFG